MSNPAGFDIKWNFTFPPLQTPPSDSKSDDPTQTEFPRTFQLFGNSPSTSSPNPSLEIKPPASPLPERHPTTLDASAPSFIPQTMATTRFDPFNVREEDKNQDDDDDDDDDVALSEHLLNTQLLDDFDAENTTTPSSTATPCTYPPIKAAMATLTSPWNDTWKPAVESPMKSIWQNNNEEHEWWDRFEPYSREDENEFDPTLQYYHGSLLDVDTIQDMNKLSITDPSWEESQAENVGEDMSALQMLESIFTDLSEAELTAALEEHGYDLDKATEALFDRKQQPEQTASPPTTNTTATSISSPPRRRQVCRHFLAGECYRKDCWFAHDLQVKVCKFWLQGSCLKGDYCEFSHHIDVNEVASKMNSQTQHATSKPIRFDESEYPGLQSQKLATKSMSSNTATRSKSAPEKKLEQEDFPSLESSTKMRTPVASKAPANFAEIAKRKATGNIKTKGTNAKKTDTRVLQRLKRPVKIPWLVTGNALNQEYLKEREQAIQYGTLRNRFFNRATAFYLNGDGAKAKAYSNEAKYYNKLMQEMNAEASRRIFERRNQHEAFVDLHGLHVDEALDMVQERLEILKNYNGIVYIVTGTGHHSGAFSNKHSKLKPVVDEFLQHQNYQYAETSMVGDNNGGIFAVNLASR
ncbi:hypothetical protein BJV82DRAFT_672353 [Fennellomyces sp. T-0311]|nr:hypothetical protein BJV82DRAFT_672353 [Fennellomyces sp. T-0311]